MLLSHSPQHPLPEVSVVTNGLILDLVKFRNEHSGITYKVFYQWVEEIYGEKWPYPESPTCEAIVRCVERLTAKLIKIKKQHSSVEKDELMSLFLQEEFCLPKLGFRKGKVVNFSPPRKPKKQASTNPDSALEACKEMKQKMYAISRNANKRLKRREAVIQKQADRIQSQQKAICEYEKKLVGSESQLKKLRAKLDRVNHRAEYWKKKVDAVNDDCASKRKKLHDEIDTLKMEVSALSSDNAELNETVQSILMSDPEITTFENGKFTDDVRACIYELLSLNVGVKKVAPIVRCVLKNVAHKSVQRLPSYSLTCQMILETLTVAQAQLGDGLAEANNFVTIQTDGTTKYGEHFTTYDVKVESVTYCLGLRHVFSGSSRDTLETFKEILSDIDSVHLSLGQEAVSSKIVSKIKNTMSDRHAAEKLFNEMLHDYRAEILPDVIGNWEKYSADEKENMTRMNNFFCGLHYVVGLAECTEEAIKLWEASVASTETSGSSGTQRLIRTACKALHHHGSQQCGSSSLFRSYLKQEGIFKIPLAQFVGNCFNILFYDAAGVYYLKDHIIQFIESIHGTQANRLLQSVLKDIKNTAFISGCRALGLIDKIVTGPLWRKLEESSISVLDMGSTYCEMKNKFDFWSEDSSMLIDGSARCILDIDISEDEVWKALISSTANDGMTQEILQLLFHAFSVTTQRLLVDHLPNGIYYNVTDEEVIAEITSVPTTNVSPERDFAVLDRYLREKPNAHTVALEAIIMFAHNKTSLWMEKLTYDERERLLKTARTLSPKFRAKFQERRREIEARRLKDLEKRAEAIARKELKAVAEKEKLTKEIAVFGLWTSKVEVENGIKLCRDQKEKRNALKLQISFRHKVLNQTNPDKSVFKFSHNRKQFSVAQLEKNLLLIIGVTEETEFSNCELQLSDIMLRPELLVGKKIRHRFQVGEDLIWYNGTVISINPKTMEHQVQYDKEEDICSFALLEDISNGDLELL